jgi:hypothetical protein
MQVMRWEPERRTWDGIVFFWAVFWLVVGGWTGYEIWQLTGLSTSTVESGHALQTAGQALQNLGHVPVIGNTTGRLGDQVTATAGDIVASGHQADRSIRSMSILIGLAVGIGPTVPLLLLYLPIRIGQRRDATDIRRAVTATGAEPALWAYLAERAVASVPYSRLRLITRDPHGDLTAGRHDALARAELARIGVRVPSAPTPR